MMDNVLKMMESYPELEFSEFSYLADSIRSMLRTITDPELELYVSAEDSK